MGSKSISNELLLEWQILSKILRSLWVIDKSTSIMMKPRSLLQLTTKFKTFILNVPYVATATYKVSESDIREVKVRGSWRGYVIADPEYYLPINEPRFYDLDTGVEKNYVLEFNEAENIYIVK